MSADPRYVRYTVGEEWSALYIEGALDRVGDHYLIDERIAALLGVEDRDSAVMRRANNAAEVPVFLSDLAAIEKDRTDRADLAAKLRSEAASLIRDAEELEA